MKVNILHKFLEIVVILAIIALLSGYGWIILIGEEVTIKSGKRSGYATAYLIAEDAFIYAGGVFLVAATFSFFAFRSAGINKQNSFIIAAAIMLPPVLFIGSKFI
jgi:hypothetical protein